MVFTELTDRQIIFHWINYNFLSIQLNKEELKEELLLRFNALPKQIQFKENKVIRPNIDYFLYEVYKNIEYSGKLRYQLLHRGYSLLESLKLFDYVAIIVLFILFQISIRSTVFFRSSPIFLFISIIILPIIKKIQKDMTKFTLKYLKLGDLFKILSGPDSYEEKEGIPNSIEAGIKFVHTPKIFVSRKEIICKSVLEYYDKGKYLRNYDLFLVIVALYYLISISKSESYTNYIYEKIIKIIQRIVAFNANSGMLNFLLGEALFNVNRIVESKKYFKDYVEILKIPDFELDYLIYIDFLDKNNI